MPIETQPEATEVSTESTESTESTASAASAASPAESVQSAPEPDAPADQADAPAEKAQRKPRKQQSTARKTRTVELVLTVTGTADGEWQAELTQSGKRVVRGLNVPAAAVSRAAAELHEDISKAIESVLDAAREQHQAKVAELEAELARAKAALAELQEG